MHIKADSGIAIRQPLKKNQKKTLHTTQMYVLILHSQS